MPQVRPNSCAEYYRSHPHPHHYHYTAPAPETDEQRTARLRRAREEQEQAEQRRAAEEATRKANREKERQQSTSTRPSHPLMAAEMDSDRHEAEQRKRKDLGFSSPHHCGADRIAVSLELHWCHKPRICGSHGVFTNFRRKERKEVVHVTEDIVGRYSASGGVARLDGQHVLTGSTS